MTCAVSFTVSFKGTGCFVQRFVHVFWGGVSVLDESNAIITSHLPLRPRLAADELVRLRVVELFLHRVPAELLPQTVADVAEVADGRRAVADFRRADRGFSRPHALDPIALVVTRRVTAPFLLADWGLHDLGGVAPDLVT